MNELIEILLGNESAISYLAAQILGMIGFIAMAIVNYRYRDDLTTTWSFKFWWSDNWSLLLLMVIGMYIGLRWQADIIDGINTHSKYDLTFIKDKWFWFIVVGFAFRVIVHQANSLYKKLTADTESNE